VSKNRYRFQETQLIIIVFSQDIKHIRKDVEKIGEAMTGERPKLR
jgi:hypothetical protein